MAVMMMTDEDVMVELYEGGTLLRSEGFDSVADALRTYELAWVEPGGSDALMMAEL